MPDERCLSNCDVGALRQNPSNAPRQIQARVRAHYIPSIRQMLTLSEAPSDRSYAVTAHKATV